MQVTATHIQDLKVIELKVFRDDRGFFVERFNAKKFEEAGLPTRFVQDNHSCSKPKVLRGLHFQYDRPQGKLVGCLRGRICDVAIDLRFGSATFGQHFAIELSAENGKLLWVPPGFAHGFCVLGEEPADVMYKVDNIYNPSGEGSIRWDDNELGVEWPISGALLSTKDAVAGSFSDYIKAFEGRGSWWT